MRLWNRYRPIPAGRRGAIRPEIDLERVLDTALRDHREGRLDAAEAGYRMALSILPDNAELLNLQGVVASQQGRHDQAVASIGRAIALTPNNPSAQFHNNLGLSLRALGDLDKALTQFARAVAVNPDYGEGHAGLGMVLSELGRLDDAAASYRQAIALKPGYAEAHNNLGNVLKQQDRLDEAIAAYRRAVAINPGYADAYTNLSTALTGSGALDEAADCCRKALAIDPGQAEAHNNLGCILKDQGRLDEASACFHRAQALRPGYADAHWNMALLLLQKGDLAEGWREYEWRWRTPGAAPRDFTVPEWPESEGNGGDLSGRTILLHAEQGFGDTIQFVRYAPLVKARGATVVVECQPRLLRLLESVAGIDRLIARGDPLPAVDCHAPMMSLPRLTGTTQGSIPGDIPYLYPRSDLVEAWQGRGIAGPGLTVGLVWRGGANYKKDRGRSIPADMLSHLTKGLPSVRWIGIQADARLEEVEILSQHTDFRDCGPDQKDWADAAALVSTLDLVITVDTAVAHLAGALGKKTWLMLSSAPDWRWMLERADSPWYPTLRLFRQAAPGDWAGVIASVRSELTSLARSSP